MTIVWFTENYPPNKGGMSRSCDRIISNLRQHHTIHIYHFTNKLKTFTEHAEVNGSYTAVPVFEDSSHGLNVLWSYIKEQKLIIESSIFVGFGSHLAIKGIPLMAKWLKKPFLTCIRGNDFDNAIFSQKKQDLLYCIKNAAAVACVTQEKVDRIKAMELNEQIYFIPNSIALEDWEVLETDLALAEHYKENVNPEVTIIGLIGYLKQKKGIDFFLDGLQKSVLRSKVHLRIVGEIEPHIETRLIQEQIPYSQVLPESKTELIANYLMCDVVVIPSIYDGMPNVIFEAAVLNIPIIASRVGGIPDVLTNDEAFLFDGLSEFSLLDCLIEYSTIETKALTKKTNKLKDKIKTQFTPAIEAKHYLDIFNKLRIK